jgi:hypothetical protein
MNAEELSLPEEKTGAASAAKLNAAPQKLSVLEKAGYSLGDLAANLFFKHWLLTSLISIQIFMV